MMRAWRAFVAAIAASALLSVGGGVSAHAASLSGNIVVNGGFEVPAESPDSVTFFTAPSSGITGWTVGSTPLDGTSAGSVEIDHFAWAFQGAQAIDLDGYNPGALYQDLSTTPGQAYTLQYALAGNFACGQVIKTMNVDWGGKTVDTPSFNTTGKAGTSPSAFGWVVRDVTVNATASTTRLEFVSTTPGSCGPTIDAVTVTPVTFANLCALVDTFEAEPGIAHSLCAKTAAARAAAARGDTRAQDGMLGAFQHEVAAQTGKTLTRQRASLLIQQAQDLM